MEKMQATLDEILTRFTATDTSVKTVSEEVTSLRKQVEEFGDEMDHIKHRVHDTGKSTPSSSSALHQETAPPPADKGHGVPLLANNHPPLLGTPQQQPSGFHTALSSPHEQDVRPTLHAQPDQEEYRPRQPRHDFPRFHGEMPLLWIDQCLTYFEMYRVPVHHWVSTATLYLDGLAAMWFQAYKRLHRRLTWDEFTGAVVTEFGHDEYDVQMTKLQQLRQTTSVNEYKAQFEECMYHLLSLDPTMSTRWFVSQFVFGLRDELRGPVRFQAPTSVTRAAALAKIQEEEVEHIRPRNRPAAPTKHPPQPVAGVVHRPALGRTELPHRQGNDDFNRERQIRDFRRANGLCFKCGDKYSKEH